MPVPRRDVLPTTRTRSYVVPSHHQGPTIMLKKYRRVMLYVHVITFPHGALVHSWRYIYRKREFSLGVVHDVPKRVLFP